MLEAGDELGRGAAGERVLVEFVSANPTGPITVASARHAAYGDSLARILERAGNRVEREYYVNDAGSQVRKFGEAIQARARGEEPEEYRGAYVTELAGQIDGAAEAEPDELALQGIALMLEWVERTLAHFRVRMDRYFSERSLAGQVDAVLGGLDGVYEHDGAVWLRTTEQRRRQGPRAAALERRADLLRHRHRLPRRQGRARLRPLDQRARAPTTTATSSGCRRSGPRWAAPPTPTRS